MLGSRTGFCPMDTSVASLGANRTAPEVHAGTPNSTSNGSTSARGPQRSRPGIDASEIRVPIHANAVEDELGIEGSIKSMPRLARSRPSDRAARRKALEGRLRVAQEKAADASALPIAHGRCCIMGLTVLELIRTAAWWQGTIPGYSVFGMHFLTTTSDIACILCAVPLFAIGTQGQCVQLGCLGPMLTLVFAMSLVDISALGAYLVVATPRPLSPGAKSYVDALEACVGVWEWALVASVALQMALCASSWRVYRELRMTGLYPPGSDPAGVGKIKEISVMEVMCEAEDVELLADCEVNCETGLKSPLLAYPTATPSSTPTVSRAEDVARSMATAVADVGGSSGPGTAAAANGGGQEADKGAGAAQVGGAVGVGSAGAEELARAVQCGLKQVHMTGPASSRQVTALGGRQEMAGQVAVGNPPSVAGPKQCPKATGPASSREVFARASPGGGPDEAWRELCDRGGAALLVPGDSTRAAPAKFRTSNPQAAEEGYEAGDCRDIARDRLRDFRLCGAVCAGGLSGQGGVSMDGEARVPPGSGAYAAPKRSSAADLRRERTR